ncbi:hypothetical protein ONS95_000980 [Cadophora gregata]|uniref:uncharacterized protein n=1 Tax=Cadophora gregata TaxID=51156 RepID=UPI0026DBDD4A|nr:uncharacterized protein ONS95_000980 [Cadophora gregata]KAK0102819.1 hypothetical protein ONS96_005454 [Cadophora gregata f. sp. sojae]KAK0129040.1 hypothetical protein ONS95_000980 [Cadophora gregata]
MEQRSEPPSFDPARRQFLNYTTRSCALEVVDPGDPSDSLRPTTRPFLPRDLAQEYFEKRGYRELHNIIDGLKLVPSARVNPGHIIPKYTAIFCTLLHSGRGSYIKHFTRFESLQDSRLPFHLNNPPENWPPTPDDPNFLSDFCKEQWRFCAPTLEAPVSDLCFEEQRVLPITYKRKLRDGGTAKLWLINIHPSYNKLISEDYKTKVGKENANTFVLKEYSTADAQKYYYNEASAFGQIGKHQHIISYYGSFTRGGTFNVILEYADKGTLKEFFEKQLPPTSGEGIIRFWEGLFQLIDALLKIHTVDADETERPQIFQGWHQDVKPENILVLSNGSDNPQDWNFKLADLGISHFKRKNSLREESTASDSYGTHTYGAPETSRPDEYLARHKLRVKQNIDIWSLGCIFSEAVRWMAEKKLGVINYRRERKVELAQIHSGGEVDCFHNGTEALETVRRSHQTALNRIRTLQKADFITEKVVDMIGDMLVETKHRPTAENLWRKQRGIVDAAKKNLRESSKLPHLLGSDSNLNERIQPRSVTHPVPSPSSNSEPRLPPVLPPEHSPTFLRQGLFVHEGQSGYPSVNESLGYNIPRHHSPENIGCESQSLETTPVQGKASVEIFGGNSPLTPPFSPKSHYPLQSSSKGSNEDLFTSSMQQNATALPYRSVEPHGAAPELSNSSAFNIPGSGISPRYSGSLGRNHQHRARYSLGSNMNGSPESQRPLTTIASYSVSSLDYPQRETPHHSSMTTTTTEVSGHPGVDGATSVLVRPSSTALEHETLQPQTPNHRPALQHSTSDYLHLTEVLDSKRRYKSGGAKKSCLNQQRQDRLKGRDHVRTSSTYYTRR